MNKSQFIEYSKLHEYKSARMYTPQNELFATFNEASNSDLNDRIMQTLDFYPSNHGFCKMILKANTTSPDSVACKTTIEMDGFDSQKLSGAPAQSVDIDKVKKEIEQKLRDEQRMREKEEELNTLKKEVKELKSNGGKLGLVLEKLAGALMPQLSKNTVPATPLAGAPLTNEEKQAEINKLNEACALFMKHTDASFVLSIAKAVDQKPELIATVKTFLNI